MRTTNGKHCWIRGESPFYNLAGIKTIRLQIDIASTILELDGIAYTQPAAKSLTIHIHNYFSLTIHKCAMDIKTGKMNYFIEKASPQL